MRQFLFWLLACAMFSAQACASTYSQVNAGIDAYNRQDWDGAIAHFTTALAAQDILTAFRTVAYFDRGIAHSGKKEWNLAIADFTQAIGSDPEYAMAYQCRAEIYAEQEHFDLAIADVSAMLANKPTLLEGYYQRADLYFVQQNYDATLADLTTVIRIEPQLAVGYLVRSVYHRMRGEYDIAIDDINEAITRADRWPLNFIERGLNYEAKGDYPRATHDFNIAIDMAPDDPDIQINLALAYWENGKLDNAADAVATFQTLAKGQISAYGAIWTWLIDEKKGKNGDNALKTFTAAYKETGWPRPILDLYAGSSTLDVMLKATNDNDPARQKRKTCEANVYGGVWQETHNTKADAKVMLNAAALNFPWEVIERDAAIAELKRLR